MMMSGSDSFCNTCVHYKFTLKMQLGEKKTWTCSITQTGKHAHTNSCTTITQKYLIQYGDPNQSTTTFTNKDIPITQWCQTTNASQCHCPRLPARGILTDYRAEIRQAAWSEPRSSPGHTIYQQTIHRRSDVPAADSPVLLCY